MHLDPYNRKFFSDPFWKAPPAGPALLALQERRWSTESRPRPPRRLFHYTSAEGLLGILRDQRVWASDPEYLNDYTELRYGEELVARALESKCTGLPAGRDLDFLTRARASVHSDWHR